MAKATTAGGGKSGRRRSTTRAADAPRAPTPRARRERQPKAEGSKAPAPDAVRLVGIGASAGGLEALERFFDAMPVDSGLAFIVVQHLSPDFRSMMDELLARRSLMAIRHAATGMAIEPNTVYLNPPRQNLVIAEGRLRLRSPEEGETPNHPIDAFFTSLASDRGPAAIGVILSGTGSDGTKGAQALLQAGGTVIVQEPASAKFENMPRSVVEKGAATAIALPEEMPALLGRIIRGEPIDAARPGQHAPVDPETDILNLLEKRYGASFSYYKPTTVGRRLRRRATLNGLQDLANYASLLRRDTIELERLYADLLIGVTAFFRDAPAFEALTAEVVPNVAEQMSADRQLRIWVPGCASGEEAYSIAIAFSEHARTHGLPLNVKIFATDLHHGSLETAGNGTYPAEALKELTVDLIERYFEPTPSGYQAKAALRRLIVFSPHNLIKDPPFTRIDLISCRNVLIYFDDVAQRKVLALFHFALVKDGYLFLGPSETLSDIQDEFEVVDGRWRIFRKMRHVQLPGATRLLPAVPTLEDLVPQAAGRQVPRGTVGPSRAMLADRRHLLKAYDTILARHAPPSLLLTRSGELVHVFGNADRFLRVRSGVFSTRVADVVIEPLKLAVATMIDGIRSGPAGTMTREVRLADGDGEDMLVELQGETLVESGSEADYLLLTLKETPRALAAAPGSRKGAVVRFAEKEALHRRVEELEGSLSFTEQSLQTTIEELETTNEELQSTNEELMSANEELQSTNEELHAVNEELYSVSSEHQRKIEELTALTNDMDHLLRCTDVGTIFLDQELKIRRFTPAVAKAFNLLDRDLGRPIEHITARFAYPGLLRDVTRVAEHGAVIEQMVNVDDLSLLLRIFPFKVADRTRGIVLTLVDVSRLRQAERVVEARNQELARVNASLEQFTYIVSHDLRAPLRTILNSAKWIEEDLGDAASEEVRGHCQRLMTYAMRLTEMLTDLMDYARLGGNGGAPGAVEAVELRALLKGVADTLDSEGRLDLACEGTLEPFVCHKAPLVQVFQNLIDNAIKYADKPVARVRVQTQDLGDQLVFAVVDDGPGIAPRHHEKIFLPFRKLEHAQDKPGTGMGLALVKKAVEDNGGMIEVISDPEVAPGTTFRFTWAKSDPSTAA